jgi:hypothetical protein
MYRICKNQSMATTTACMPVMGTPTDPAIMTVRTRLELGIGVVPTEASVDSRTTIMYSVAVRVMPWVTAKKTTTTGK